MTREEAKRRVKSDIYQYADFSDNPNEDEFWQALDMLLEQEPCEDAISRQAVLDAMYKLCDTGETLKENPWRDNPHIDAITETIDELPSVTPQPKTGHWKVIRQSPKSMHSDVTFICNVCGHKRSRYHGEILNYCPNCGAKMG